MQWSNKTRGGYWVRNIHRHLDPNETFVWRGEVGGHCSEVDFNAEQDWTDESWMENGHYCFVRDEESITSMDLVEVEDGRANS